MLFNFIEYFLVNKFQTGINHPRAKLDKFMAKLSRNASETVSLLAGMEYKIRLSMIQTRISPTAREIRYCL